MSLKIKLINKERTPIKQDFTAKDAVNAILEIKKSVKSLDKYKKIINQDLIGKLKKEIKYNRLNYKDAMSVNNKIKQFEMTSPSNWLFYKESESVETGATEYDRNPIKVAASASLEYSKDKPIKEQVSELKNLALTEVRQMRKMRREIMFQEKELTIPETPIKAKYVVYKGGTNGASGEFNYRDAWRGTDIKVELTGGSNLYFIHTIPGEIMRLQNEMKLKRVFKDKKPTTNDNHVGVEIEFIAKGDKYTVAKALVKHNVENFVCLKGDGSLRGEDEYKYTHELTVCVKESEHKEIMRRIIDALNEAEARVNKTCGLHVHLDMRNRDHLTVFNNLVKAQDILYAMNPKIRTEGSGYSRRVTTSSFDEAVGNVLGNRQDRYSGINAQSYAKYKTLEVRLHSGSTNYEKITNWVDILVKIASSTEKYETKNIKPETLAERYELSSELLAYMKERITKFRNSNGEHITVEEVA